MIVSPSAVISLCGLLGFTFQLVVLDTMWSCVLDGAGAHMKGKMKRSHHTKHAEAYQKSMCAKNTWQNSRPANDSMEILFPELHHFGQVLDQKLKPPQNPSNHLKQEPRSSQTFQRDRQSHSLPGWRLRVWPFNTDG